jgi:hypothetical protein
MTPVTTVRAQLPCPCCGVLGPRTVAVRAESPTSELVEAGSSRGLPAGEHDGLISECSACWSRRADRIATARQRLQVSGELSSLGPGREDAWLGVPLSRCEDVFANAFASALLTTAQGGPWSEPARLEQLDVEQLEAEPATPEPDLVGV